MLRASVSSMCPPDSAAAYEDETLEGRYGVDVDDSAIVS